MPGFFKPGNKYGKGRPFKSKNQIEPIRRRILTIVRKRIMHEKDLESVTTTDLLKFLSSIMPKDWISVQAPQITYISSVPREEPLLPILPIDKIELDSSPLIIDTKPLITNTEQEPENAVSGKPDVL